MQGPLLIVEDHDTSRMVYHHLANLLQLDIDLADDCASAIRLAPERPYKLVIMDIGLPDLDGCQCAGKLRPILQLSVPVLAITAHAMAGDREAILASGIEDYLAKPFTIEEFKEKLRKWNILPESAVAEV